MLLTHCSTVISHLRCSSICFKFIRGQKSFFNCFRFASSTLSRNGFNNYEKERREFDYALPEKFNFASDILDTWAKKEQTLERSTDIPSFWFVYEDGKQIKWSFKELAENSKRTANILEKQCGLTKGDTLLILLPKLPEFWLLNIAAIRTGVILSAGSMQLRAKDLRYRFGALKPKCIIAEESIAEMVDEVIDSCSTIETKILVSPSKRTKKGWMDFNQMYEKSSSDHQCISTSSNDPMMIFFTSGTTGMPKMVEHTQASYGIGLSYTGRFFLDLTPQSIIWNLSDTGWAKSAYSNIFAPWSMGACVFIHQMKRFQPSVFIDVLSKFPIDTLCAPPSVYRMVLQEKLSEVQFPHLEHCVCGGEPANAPNVTVSKPLVSFITVSSLEKIAASQVEISETWILYILVLAIRNIGLDWTAMLMRGGFLETAVHGIFGSMLVFLDGFRTNFMTEEVIRSWIKATGLRLYEGYGQTETVMCCGMFKCLDYRPGSMGKPPPGTNLVILDENGLELGPNQKGEIAIKRKPISPVGIFKEYKGDPEKTTSKLNESYVKMGDAAYYDEDGYFWFVSRLDDIINSAGYRIGPYEVENALADHPAVVEAAVVSSPDKMRGEVVKAFIVLTKEYSNCDEVKLIEELQNHVKTVTAPYKYPRKIEFVGELPRTVSGKVKRFELKNRERNRE